MLQPSHPRTEKMICSKERDVCSRRYRKMDLIELACSFRAEKILASFFFSSLWTEPKNIGFIIMPFLTNFSDRIVKSIKVFDFVLFCFCCCFLLFVCLFFFHAFFTDFVQKLYARLTGVQF